MPRRRENGFTLVELMVVVVVITVLSVLAVTAFRRYTARARATEVFAMFAEIRAKEESYRAEYSAYLNVSSSDTDFYPVLNSAGPEPSAKTWAPTNPNWVALGVNPPRSQLYCGYAVISGAANDAGTMSNVFTTTFVGTVPATSWWVATAMCDFDGTPGTLESGLNAAYVTSSRSTVIHDENPAR